MADLGLYPSTNTIQLGFQPTTHARATSNLKQVVGHFAEKRHPTCTQLNMSQIQEKKDQLRQEWIELSSAWIKESREGRNPTRNGLLDQPMLEACGNVEGLQVLDCGCGEGRFCRIFTSPMIGFKRTRMSDLCLMLLTIEGQKVEGIGPSALEEGIRDREQEPAGASNGPTIATSFGHDVDTGLQEVKGLNRRDMGA